MTGPVMENNRYRTGAVQDTGNPVFDATTNLIMNWPCNVHFTPESIAELHNIVSALLEKEPKVAVRPRLTAKELQSQSAK